MKRFVVLAFCSALTLPAAAVAQDQPAADQPAAPVAMAKAEKPKKVCKSEADAIASRLGTKRVCKTQEEWDAIDARKAGGVKRDAGR